MIEYYELKAVDACDKVELEVAHSGHQRRVSNVSEADSI